MSQVTDQRVNLVAVFGALDAANASPVFLGGRVSTLMGAAKLDLSAATPAPTGADLSTSRLFGGIDVIVPRGWDVRITGTSVFGGVGDQTTPTSQRDGPRLSVKGLAVFGGIAVKHA